MRIIKAISDSFQSKFAVVKKSEIPLAVWVEGMNGKSFTITPMKSGFYESSDTCESFGSYLATILDINDQKTISETIKNVKAQNEIFFWIGKLMNFI